MSYSNIPIISTPDKESEKTLKVVHSKPKGYCYDLTEEENRILDRMAKIISKHILNLEHGNT